MKNLSWKKSSSQNYLLLLVFCLLAGMGQQSLVAMTRNPKKRTHQQQKRSSQNDFFTAENFHNLEVFLREAKQREDLEGVNRLIEAGHSLIERTPKRVLRKFLRENPTSKNLILLFQENRPFQEGELEPWSPRLLSFSKSLRRPKNFNKILITILNMRNPYFLAHFAKEYDNLITDGTLAFIKAINTRRTRAAHIIAYTLKNKIRDIYHIYLSAAKKGDLPILTCIEQHFFTTDMNWGHVNRSLMESIKQLRQAKRRRQRKKAAILGRAAEHISNYMAANKNFPKLLTSANPTQPKLSLILIDAAARGDLLTVRYIHESRMVMIEQSCKPALVYALNFYHPNVVEYLLNRVPWKKKYIRGCINKIIEVNKEVPNKRLARMVKRLLQKYNWTPPYVVNSDLEGITSEGDRKLNTIDAFTRETLGAIVDRNDVELFRTILENVDFGNQRISLSNISLSLAEQVTDPDCALLYFATQTEGRRFKFIRFIIKHFYNELTQDGVYQATLRAIRKGNKFCAAHLKTKCRRLLTGEQRREIEGMLRSH